MQSTAAIHGSLVALRTHFSVQLLMFLHSFSHSQQLHCNSPCTGVRKQKHGRKLTKIGRMNHRIVEYPGLKRTTMLIYFQLLQAMQQLHSFPHAMGRVTNHQTRLSRATSSLALNASRDEASTASLGNLFQYSTTQREDQHINPYQGSQQKESK